MNKKVLIVGGAGYIGSHQVKIMCDLKYEVVVFDNLSTGHENAIDNQAHLIKGDLTNYEEINKALRDEKPAGIIHLGGSNLAAESRENPLEYYHNNLLGMENLLKAMIEQEIDNIVFASTAEVYGSQEADFISEESVPNPESPYAQTKLAMENMAKWVSQSSNIKYMGLRYFNVAGANSASGIGERHKPETHIIPLTLQKGLGLIKELKVFGNDYPTKDGTCYRDFVHITDVCNANVSAFETLIANKKVNQIYNVGYGVAFTVLDVIRAAEEVCQTKIEYEFVDRRPGDTPRLVAKGEKIKEDLGVKYRYNDLKIIIKSAYDFYHEHKYTEKD